MQEKELIINYFNNISSSYDENNKKLYWKLSDDLLWDVIQEYIPKKRKITFLDLGGGTGEWAYKILSKYDNTSCVLVDFSNEMLKHAKEKLSQFSERVKIINCDLDKLNLNEKFDIVLNIYVLPFFYNSEKLIETVSNHLKEHGKYKIEITENNDDYIDINTQFRDLTKGVAMLEEDKYNNTLTIMLDGGDWSGIWSQRMHTEGLVRLGYLDFPIRFFAPIILDWSGSKFSKSLYLKDGAYKGINQAFINYNDFINYYGKIGMKRLWNEVCGWIDEPKKFFRNYSVDYFQMIMEGYGNE